MLVLDAVGEIDAVRQRADLRLDDMGGRGRTVRHVPFVLPVEQRRFFLRAGKRDAEFLVGADAERIAREVANHRRNLLVVHGAAIDRACAGRRHSFGKELQRTDAVAADRRKQAVSIGAVRLRAFGYAPADVVIVGKEVFEDGQDRIADVAVFAQRKRNRDGNGVAPSQPVLVVLEIDRAAALAAEPPDQAVRSGTH